MFCLNQRWSLRCFPLVEPRRGILTRYPIFPSFWAMEVLGYGVESSIRDLGYGNNHKV